MAAYWAGERVIDETASDAAALGVIGMPEPKIETCEVMPEIWQVLELFLNVQTQWRVDSGNIVGLDYFSVKWMMELMHIEKPFEVLQDLQVIESKIIETLSDRSK